MKCTNCGKNVKDGTAICPNCDAILDSSFLEGDSPQADGDDTPPPDDATLPPAPAARRAATVAAKPAARKPLRKAPVPTADPEPEAEPEAAATEEDPGKYKGKYAQYWPDSDKEQAKPKKAEPAPVAAPVKKVPTVDPNTGIDADLGADPTQYVKDLWAAFLGLHFEDKLTTGAAAALAFATLLPWRGYLDVSDSSEADELGIMTWGFLIFLFAAAAVGTIWARKTGKVPQVPKHLLPKIAMGLGALSAVICVLFAFGAWTRVTSADFGGKSVTETTSWPAFGVYFAVLAAVALALGGFLTDRRERQ